MWPVSNGATQPSPFAAALESNGMSRQTASRDTAPQSTAGTSMTGGGHVKGSERPKRHRRQSSIIINRNLVV